MHDLRRVRRSASLWLVGLALLALVFMPTVSRLMAPPAPGEGWVEVCTPTGLKWVSLIDAASGAPDDPAVGDSLPSSQHLLDHCAYCALSGVALVPPQPSVWVAPPALGHELPRLFLQAPRPLFAWAAAQPRGPPISV